MCWQLDPTEGPGRVRRRLIRAPRTVSSRHFLEESSAQKAEEQGELGPLGSRLVIMYNVFCLFLLLLLL